MNKNAFYSGMLHFKLPAKLLLIMRLTTFILILSLTQVSAASFAQRLNYVKKNASLKEIFAEVKKQTGYHVFYADQGIDVNRKVNVDFRNTDLRTALNQVVADQNLEYVIDARNIILKAKTLSVFERIINVFKTLDVTGRVVDEEGKPLAGASIFISTEENVLQIARLGDKGIALKMKNVGAITNANGEFTLRNVDERAFIIVTFLGYKPQQLKAAKDLGNISMQLDAGKLVEVNIMVNTGYQTLSRERSAGSYAKPDMKILEARSGTTNVLQRLDGLIPGLVINNSSSPTGNGGVGKSSSGNSVMIRGLNTLNANRDPLIVLNGVPVDDVSKINPNDVEDVTILKDATSASIWGAKAANGVIVILTKKGKTRDALSVNYDGFVNLQGKPDIGNLNMLNSSQFIEAAKAVFDPNLNAYATISKPAGGGKAPVMPHETILYNLEKLPQEQVDAKLAQLASQDGVAQMKELFYRNAVLMNHSISLTGGGNKYSFYGSGSYTNTQNSKPGDKNRNYGLNLHQDFQLNKRIKFYLITDLVNNDLGSLNFTQPTSAFLPYALFRNPDGSNADLSWLYRDNIARTGYESKSRVSLAYSPLDEMNRGRTSSNIFTARANGGASVNLVKGLRYEGVFSISKAQTKIINDLDQNNYDVRAELAAFTPLNGSKPYLPETGGRHTTTNSLQKNWTVRNQLIFDQAWKNGEHQLVLLAGQEAQEQFYNLSGSVVRGYNSQLLSNAIIDYNLLSLGVGNVVMPTSSSGTSQLTPDFYNETESMVRISSYYANGGYTFNNKYTLNAATRIDQSNLFGKDKSAQNKPLWSFGLAWQLGRETFMQKITWVDKLILRSSYGLTGNSPNPGSAASKDILAKLFSGYAILYPEGNGLEMSTPANKKLTWETTRNLNVGIDFSLLKNRLGGSLDFYSKKTENLIGEMPVNILTGYATITGNAGNMTNKGIDLNLNSVNISTRDFRWSTLLNLGFNKNEITYVNRATPIIRGDQLISNPYVQGYPAFAVFAYNYAGLDSKGDPQIRLKDGTVTKARSVATVDDMKYMGTFQPKLSGGLSNTFAYGDFTLSLNAVYNLGYVMRRDVNSLFGGRGLIANSGFNAMYTGNINAEFANRWKKPGDEAFTNVPAYTTAPVTAARGSMTYYTNADQNVLDASYIKLRDITLAYSLPKGILSRLRADAVTFRVQLSNVMLWKANSHGIDPEFMDAYGGWDGSANIVGIYSGGYRKVPVNQHTITFGAHVTF
ncbi:TonB-linked SusC/RagA family outer membrane protein [Pedobacter africanus]|uniref:TonB-linked SusC/RagA family outer membrane protein n=1 Tax=Pedobacter africanus TaxID=151894 RepID=A0ACC6KQX9_9SPHI|nr:SusC/RagA family TonB-linked outer membrane protein [Pedobacter africanus]MDR6781533.1 TonB-linked SusC/RagA family outer membrane protein [Pedobacter africanus]